MKKDEKVRRIFEDLERRYGPSFSRDPGTALAKVTTETEDPFRVLIATILSQRTRDEKTEEASTRLFARYDTPRAIARAPLGELVDLTRPVGFYRQKAAKLKEVSHILLRKFGGEVPDAYEDLVALPQVGPKTANCVLVYGFGKPAIPVDVHVAVISRRLGLAPPFADEEEVERHLSRIVPRPLWLQLNERFVRFGKDVCRTSFPRCGACSFTGFCRYFRATGRRRNPGESARPPGVASGPPPRARGQRQRKRTPARRD